MVSWLVGFEIGWVGTGDDGHIGGSAWLPSFLLAKSWVVVVARGGSDFGSGGAHVVVVECQGSGYGLQTSTYFGRYSGNT